MTRVMVILQLQIPLETFGADFDFLDVRGPRGGGFLLLILCSRVNIFIDKRSYVKADKVDPRIDKATPLLKFLLSRAGLG